MQMPQAKDPRGDAIEQELLAALDRLDDLTVNEEL